MGAMREAGEQGLHTERCMPIAVVEPGGGSCRWRRLQQANVARRRWQAQPRSHASCHRAGREMEGGARTAADTVSGVAERAKESASEAADRVRGAAGEAAGRVRGAADEVASKAEGAYEHAREALGEAAGKASRKAEEAKEAAKEKAEEAKGEAAGRAQGAKESAGGWVGGSVTRGKAGFASWRVSGLNERLLFGSCLSASQPLCGSIESFVRAVPLATAPPLTAEAAEEHASGLLDAARERVAGAAQAVGDTVQASLRAAPVCCSCPALGLLQLCMLQMQGQR